MIIPGVVLSEDNISKIMYADNVRKDFGMEHYKSKERLIMDLINNVLRKKPWKMHVIIGLLDIYILQQTSNIEIISREFLIAVQIVFSATHLVL